MNLSVFVSTVVGLTMKCIYFKYKNMNPVFLIFLKSLLGLLGVLIYSGRDTREHMTCKQKFMKPLFYRVAMTAASILIFNIVCKYFPLVYIGLGGNLVPLITVFLSYLFLGEIINKFDKIAIFISIIGVGVITTAKFEAQSGQSDKKMQHDHTPILGVLGLFMLPLLSSSGAILMRKMKGLHWLTLTIYLNMFLILVSGSILYYQGASLDYIWKFDSFDWFCILVSVFAENSCKSFRLVALRYE